MLLSETDRYQIKLGESYKNNNWNESVVSTFWLCACVRAGPTLNRSRTGSSRCWGFFFPLWSDSLTLTDVIGYCKEDGVGGASLIRPCIYAMAMLWCHFVFSWVSVWVKLWPRGKTPPVCLKKSWDRCAVKCQIYEYLGENKVWAAEVCGHILIRKTTFFCLILHCRSYTPSLFF